MKAGRILSACSLCAPMSSFGGIRCHQALVCRCRIGPVRRCEGRAYHHACRVATSRDMSLQSDAERFVEALENTDEESGTDASHAEVARLQDKLEACQQQVAQLQSEIDVAYRECFEGAVKDLPDELAVSANLQAITEASFGTLGRTNPEAMSALLGAKQKGDPSGWRAFQERAHALKNRRTRARREAEDLEASLFAAQTALRLQSEGALEDEDGGGQMANVAQSLSRECRIVLVSGFESFNVELYKKAARRVKRECPGIDVQVFSDRDITDKRAEMEAALQGADVFFGSLLFDYDQVEWLREHVSDIPIRLVFESALELMGTTQLGGFKMDPSGKSKGPPPAVKKVLSLFGSGREEDRMVGYLSFLKIGPKLLKFLPGQKARDLRNWLTVYSYWNQGGQDNVATMLLYLVDQYLAKTGIQAKPVQETPATGCLHPDYDGYFETPAQYLKWYIKHGPLKDKPNAPTVAVLLYRKHVITEQGYIPQLVRCFEEEGVRPVPIFINGIEAHTVVRDLLTTEHEQQLKKANQPGPVSSLSKDAILVDAVVSTIGFPLVGGPAGTMEGGRQADVAKAILTAKNVPYVVAAPLLIQDLTSWTRDGIAGLQSVVLYSLPELDGAIDTVPLGGLMGNNIFLVPERVKRLSGRLRKWVTLRRTPTHERKIAVLLYGFPPGVGATGTAALLNVPKSLERMLEQLQAQGYDLGLASGQGISGEAIVDALRMQEDQRSISSGAAGIEKAGAGEAEAFGARAAAADMTPKQLKEHLTFPQTWGPTEWGPISFLPEHDILVRNMERQWGDLDRYRGINTSAKGNYVVGGVQLGNVWIGVQPALGLEGDPMRLLFERDLTPHPQYAAFYKWLQQVYCANAVLHFGMHGTVEWLPGAPLGNSGFSWSDVLLGDLPNVYVYAANNPSESIIAKRRGYGTIISHNVPPYGRAGLYKQMAGLKALVSEYREKPAANAALKEPIVDALQTTGLQEDCPFSVDEAAEPLSPESAGKVPDADFAEYAGRLNSYLQVVEGRLFSEGLHVLGQPPSDEHMRQYLEAYFGDDLPEEVVGALVGAGNESVDTLRQRMERSYEQVSAHAPGEASSSGRPDLSRLEEGLEIRGLLRRNTEELDGVMRALNGEYIEPEAGGDLLRDGAGVLPTGRNIHALDPYRMPSQAALERGSAVAQGIIDSHVQANGGAYPETVAVNLWGLDAIKTKGESVAVALYMVGARPVREGTGRIARFELIPLEEMDGRPRVDVLCNMSGIFRDSFQNVVELLDDLFQRAADADEPEDRNFIRKHVHSMKSTGLENPAARLFSNPAGDYGSMVNERVGAGNWDSGQELGDTWASRNAFSYGRGGERGTARPEVLQSLLKTTERVVQEIDSVEYGLTDIQEYYANTGALKNAAETAQGGKKVGCSIVETFSKSTKPRELEEVLRLEYRSKLLNPKWAQAMADQGSGGAYEISQRMTAMVGWGATTNFQEDWTWDQAAQTYALDRDMADRLRKNNPQALLWSSGERLRPLKAGAQQKNALLQAFRNVVRRMLEASGRGMWNASQDKLEDLQSMLNDIEDELEGVK